ncbi:MAG: LCP family protein [Nocardioides sp.]|uniref:LCP family protein n=1 Tax=Nocardioides sp. TaxID=35761 RepID=UPI0039E3E1A4
MADGPRAPGGPEKGTPEYDWLYGPDPAAAGGADDDPTLPMAAAGPDATRLMKTTPVDSGQGDPRTPTAPRRAQQPPGQPPVGPPTASPRKKRRFGGWFWARLVLVAWLAFLVAVPFWAWSKIEKVDAFPDKGRPGDQDGTTYLVVGSDSREGLSAAQRKRLGTGDAAGERTDTIMLLHTGSGPNLLLSIPRDSLVEIPGHGTTKINAAFAYGGPKLLVQTIENSTGIRIDDYIEIGFGGFVNAVDAVGGVEICPTRAMKDPLANLDIPKGCQQADGVTALGYARSRHVYADSDFTRVVHQREVVSAVGHKAVSPWSVVNPVRYWRLNMALDSLRISKGTGPIALGKFGWAMTHLSGSGGMSCTVPVADSAIHWDTERADALFKLIAADETDKVGKSLCTAKGY